MNRIEAFVALALGVALALPPGNARAENASADAHARHHFVMQAQPEVTRTLATIQVPDVWVTGTDGAPVKLAPQMDDGRPVLLDFVYTTCSTICPVMSGTFAEVQRRLGANAARVRMLSISIDPEEDTPARLDGYSKKFEAGPQWSFYTGTVETSVAVQRAFGIYRGDKMNHTSIIFFRKGPGAPWVRLDGLVTPQDILQEIFPRIARQ